jgi:hypothetical protein
MTHGGAKYTASDFIPHQVYPLLHCSPIKPEFYYYWWRAVSITYLTRPNDETRMLLSSLHPNQPYYRDDLESCIAMFVRHGDKGIEMKLHEFNDFATVAKQMWNHGMIPGGYNYLKKHRLLKGRISEDPVKSRGATASSTEGDPASHHHRHHNSSDSHNTERGDTSAKIQTRKLGVKRNKKSGYRMNEKYHRKLSFQIQEEEQQYLSNNKSHGLFYYDYEYHLPFNGTLFITTEDPKVLAEADNWGKENHWKILYTNLFDRASQTAYKDWNEQHKRGTKAVHDSLEYLSMMLNLQFAMQCESWICTLASNSCRMMDELRATIGGKANRFYADISPETCNDVPCLVNYGNIKTFGD